MSGGKFGERCPGNDAIAIRGFIRQDATLKCGQRIGRKRMPLLTIGDQYSNATVSDDIADAVGRGLRIDSRRVRTEGG